jgi:septal ring factor EnvC (AmiA/AmiB activator)
VLPYNGSQIQALKLRHHQDQQKDQQAAAALLEAAKQSARQQLDHLQAQHRQQLVVQEESLNKQHLADIQAMEAKHAADAAALHNSKSETSQQVAALQKQLQAAEANGQQLKEQIVSLTMGLERARGDAAKALVSFTH